MTSRNNLVPTNQQILLDDIGWIPLSALINGTRILAGSGSGKTLLSGWIDWRRFDLGIPNLVFDPTGSLISDILQRILTDCQQRGLSAAQQEQRLQHIIYIDLSGRTGYVMPFSLFHRHDDEPLSAASDRILSWILSSMPESKQAPIQGYSAIDKVMRPVAKLMAAMQPEVQITEVPDLLANWKQPIWKERLQQATRRYPQETAEAMIFLTKEFKAWKAQERERRLNLLEVWLSPFRYSPAFRATFGASQPGLDFDQIISQGQTVLIDASGLYGEDRQLMLTWILLYSFVSYIRHRGSGRHTPVGLTIDEISTFYTSSPASMELFAQNFGELVHVLRRQYRIMLTVIHQSVSQLHPQMAAHLAALGNQIIGRPADFESALLIAEQLFDYRPVIKRWEPIYGYLPDEGPQVIDYRPIEYTQEEVRQIQAQQLMKLDTFRFLAKLTRSEGSGQTRLKQLDTRAIIGQFPNEQEINQLRRDLAAQSGVPVDQVLADIDARHSTRMQAAKESAIVPNTPHYDDQGYKIDS